MFRLFTNRKLTLFGAVFLLALVHAGGVKAAVHAAGTRDPITTSAWIIKSSPVDGSTTPVIVEFHWGSNPSVIAHEICFDDTDNSACDDTWHSTGSNTSYTSGELINGQTYYWQVRGDDTDGRTVYADNGTWWSFTAVLQVPGAFGKTAPANGANAAAGPALSWSASDYAADYEYCADESNNDACDTSWVSTGGSTGTVLSGLIKDTTYFWQVRAVNISGTEYADGGSWWSFKYRIPTFADVPVDHPFWAEIEAFYNAGITTGCGVSPLRFCPDNTVTRAAMAVFLLRAKYGAAYEPPAATHTFSDLPVVGKEWQEAWVDQFYLEGITSGCGVSPLRYCPENAVTRAAMAVFILRTLEGPSYTPPAASHFFADMPVAGKEWMEAWVDEVYSRGITTGCGTGPLIFCPENSVKRQAMAAFIVRAFNLPLP